MMLKRSTLLFTLLLVFLAACKRDSLPKETRILNNWIWEGMNELYLWADYIPDLDPDIQPDPEEFFYRILYEEDRNSWITDDYDALVAWFQGVDLTTGMSARPGRIDNDRVISIVEYVTPGSPAAGAGIQRGDIIITIDGQTLNPDNYYDLYDQVTATFGFGDWNGSEVVSNGVSLELTAIELNQNPVIHREVISYGGHQVGYFVYTQFTNGGSDEWLDELKSVFEEFKTAGITDVVLDLRYNPGGSLDLAAYIAASLVPRTVMEDRDLFTRLVWNDLLNQYWQDEDLDEDGEPDGEDSPQLSVYLPQSDLNLDLTSAYFLTTGLTASASELLMTGLYPYMEVTQIGQTTYGKPYASITVDDWEEPKRHNWAMQPLVLKYTNAEGFTDFVQGIAPDYPVEDDLMNAKPFG
ncbi:MAG: PDZ domain-containing protein, partial [Bacteroidetes bacterium]